VIVPKAKEATKRKYGVRNLARHLVYHDAFDRPIFSLFAP
jgi:hypothetical protein